MKILILGKNGFISSKYQEYFTNRSIEFETLSLSEFINCNYRNIFEDMAKYVANASHYEDKSYVARLVQSKTLPVVENFTKLIISTIRQYDPHCVLNCIGYTGNPNIDEIATSYSASIKNIVLNQYLPMILGACIEKTKIAHISTGCIYYSYSPKAGGWTEICVPDVATQKMSHYSLSKYQSELAILKNENVKCFRLRIPFDASTSRKNYLIKILKYKNLLSMKNSLSFIDSFVQSTTYLIEHDAPSGVYNVTNPLSVDARYITRMMKKFNLVPKSRKFNFYDDYDDFMEYEKIIEPRSNCILNSKKISKIIPAQFMPDVKIALEQCIKKLV